MPICDDRRPRPVRILFFAPCYVASQHASFMSWNRALRTRIVQLVSVDFDREGLDGLMPTCHAAGRGEVEIRGGSDCSGERSTGAATSAVAGRVAVFASSSSTSESRAW